MTTYHVRCWNNGRYMDGSYREPYLGKIDAVTARAALDGWLAKQDGPYPTHIATKPYRSGLRALLVTGMETRELEITTE